MVFVSPRLNAGALKRLYDDVGYFEGERGVYGNESGRFALAMFLQRQWIRGRLDLTERESTCRAAGSRLLEIGCAYGLFLDAARKRGYEVTGVELSAGAADQARSRARPDRPFQPARRRAARGSVRRDVRVGHPRARSRSGRVLATIRGLLADDGVVLFSTPYFSSLPARLLRPRWPTLKPTEHIWHFTPQTHRTVAAKAGLEVTRTMLSPVSRANFARLDSLVGVARPAR